AIDGGVAAAVDHAASVRIDFEPVAMAPHRAAAAAVVVIGIDIEIAGAIALLAGIVPEAERHRGHRLGADQLADFVAHRMPGCIEGFDRGAEQAALHGAGYLRRIAAAADESAREIGAARDV